jgi:hypothetical protein
MSALHLYQITERFQSLNALADSDDIPADVIRDTLESVNAEWDDKAEAVAQLILNLESSALSIEAAAEAQAERARRLAARADQLRAYLLFQMQATGRPKLERDAITIAVLNNPQKVVIDNQADVPAAFMVQKPPPPPAPDRIAIGKAFKAGESVAGCHVEVNQRLEIKP